MPPSASWHAPPHTHTHTHTHTHRGVEVSQAQRAHRPGPQAPEAPHVRVLHRHGPDGQRQQVIAGEPAAGPAVRYAGHVHEQQRLLDFLCRGRGAAWQSAGGGGGVRRSKSIPHMHVLVCICSNVEAVLTAMPRTALIQAHCTLIGRVLFGSHNLWLQYYIHGNLVLIIQILAQGWHSVRGGGGLPLWGVHTAPWPNTPPNPKKAQLTPPPPPPNPTKTDPRAPGVTRTRNSAKKNWNPQVEGVQNSHHWPCIGRKNIDHFQWSKKFSAPEFMITDLMVRSNGALFQTPPPKVLGRLY